VSDHWLDLVPVVSAPALARAALGRWLAKDSLDSLAGLEDKVLLVTSELVTNAVVHASTAVQLSYWANGWRIEVGVTDEDPRPLPPTPSASLLPGALPLLRTGGRGLLIIGASADEWGVSAVKSGKRVWARWWLPP